MPLSVKYSCNVGKCWSIESALQVISALLLSRLTAMKPIKKTTLCRQLNADRQPFDEFRRRAVAAAAMQPDAAGITLDLCEWLDEADEGIETLGLKSVPDLDSASKGMVRVM